MSCTLAHSRTRVVVLAAGEEVRRGQAALGEPRAVGAAADDRPAPARRRRAGSPPRRQRRRRGCWSSTCAHVPVRLLDLDVHARARLALGDLVGQPAQERDVLLEHRVVVVAHDEASMSVSSAVPRDPASGGRSPRGSSVVSGERPSRGSEATRSAASLTALTSLPFAEPGWTPLPRIVTPTPCTAENVSISSSPMPGAVERVGEVGAEAARGRSGRCRRRSPRRR